MHTNVDREHSIVQCTDLTCKIIGNGIGRPPFTYQLPNPMAVVLAIIGTNDMYDLCEHVYFKWPRETKYTFIFLECESYKTCVNETFQRDQVCHFSRHQNTHKLCGHIHIVHNCSKVYPMQTYNATHPPYF